MHAIQRYRALLPFLESEVFAYRFERAICPCAPGAVHSGDFLGLGVVVETEHVAADARAAGLGHVEAGGFGGLDIWFWRVGGAGEGGHTDCHCGILGWY